MAWFHRWHDDPPAAPDPTDSPDPGDSPESLRRRLAEVVRLVNRSAGQLPNAATVNARRLTDILAEIIDTSEVRPLDVYAVLFVRKTLEDYLPTTLHAYLAVAPELRETARPSGRTPVESLLAQVEALTTSASSTLTAVHNQDVDALMTQGSFLRTKFSGSDLDL